MFKGLTPRAQRVITVLSQEEGRRNRSDEIEPEHIILAVLEDGECTGFRALRNLRIDTIDLHTTLERSLERRRAGFILGDLPLSQRSRSLIEFAMEEAEIAGSEYIGTEHFIIAAAREEGSSFERFLARLGIYYDQIRSASRGIHDSPQGSGNSSPETDEEQGLNMASMVGGAGGSGPSAEDPFVRAEKTPRSAGSPRSGSKTPLLDEHARDLTRLATERKLDPVVGRDHEIARIIRILSRRRKNNPVLVGEPGVGKTAIVEAIAERLARGEVPADLQSKRILALDMASVLAGTKYRGEFEERLKKIMKEAAGAGDVILFIDEIHTVIGAGGAEGSIDASNMLKPALSRGEIQCIGATTLDEYRKYFEKDPALERRFQRVLVEEPNAEESLAIIKGIKARYEDFHRVSYSESALKASVELSRRYVAERFLPDKAIDLIDEAGAYKKVLSPARPPEFAALEKNIAKLNEEELAYVATLNYEKAAETRDSRQVLENQLEMLKAQWVAQGHLQTVTVTEDDLRYVLSEATGIPVGRLADNEASRLLSLEAKIHERVVGQDEAISAVAASVRRSRAGVSDGRRPLGSFIFLGPTGVGKTLVAKSLAEQLFGSEDALIRIDMSDYMERHNSARLVGAPPGYVGYDEGGMLTEAVRRRPYSVVLFDEIEKAHPDVFNLLLQLLEEGELRDNLGHVVSFRNAVIIMTSNAGAREIQTGGLGFRPEDRYFSYDEIRTSALSELKRRFNPEFVNRVDDIVVFKPLSRQEVRKILDLLLSELGARLAPKGIFLETSAGARDYLAEKGYDPTYGARPMRRLIQSSIEDRLAEEMLAGRLKQGGTALVEMRSGQIVIRTKKKGGVPENGPKPVEQP